MENRQNARDSALRSVERFPCMTELDAATVESSRLSPPEAFRGEGGDNALVQSFAWLDCSAG